MIKSTKLLTVWAAAILANSSTAIAHDFSELVIDRVAKTSSGSYVEILLSNTAGGRYIVCAVFDETGQALASDTQFTDNLVTRVLIRYEGADVVSARCVFND